MASNRVQIPIVGLFIYIHIHIYVHVCVWDDIDHDDFGHDI